MKLGIHIKTLRRQIGLSQEALGAQGFVSAPGLIKIESGQRQPSEKFIERLTQWLVEEKYLRASAAENIKEEMFILKYLEARSPFLRDLAKARAKTMPDGGVKLLAELPMDYKPKRGRPRKHASSGVALVAETAGVYKTKRDRRRKSSK